MAKYRVSIKPSAVKELESVEPKKLRQKIAERISALGDNPRPPGCEKISGKDYDYRIRQGDYRVVYTVMDKLVTVVVVKIGNRREVYRR